MLLFRSMPTTGYVWFCCVRFYRMCGQEERRKASIQKARGQLVLLREGLQSLRDTSKEDGRPALEDAVKPTIQKVCVYVCVVAVVFLLLLLLLYSCC